MLQKFKNIFPWLLIVALSLMLLLERRERKVLKDDYESIIDSLKSMKDREESIVDSFFVLRSEIKDSRDSTMREIDTMGIYNLGNLLKLNIKEYEENFGY